MSADFKIGNFYVGDGASWHKEEDSENPILDGMSVTDATTATGMYDVEVVKVPRTRKITLKDGTQVTVGGDKGDELYDLFLTEVPWEDNRVVDLGRVVNWYEPIQNSQYASILDPLTAKYQLSSAIMIGKMGEIVIYQFKMGDFSVAGNDNELHETRFTIAEDRRYGKHFRGITTTRIVCRNTFDVSLNNGIRSLPSSKDAHMALRFEVEAEQYRVQQMEQLNMLFKKPAKVGAAQELAGMLFPMPKPSGHMVRVAELGDDFMGQNKDTTIWGSNKALKDQEHYERGVQRTEKHREEFLVRCEKNKDELGDTAYALFQGVTEHYTHSDLFRATPERRMINSLFGGTSQAINTAWSYVMEM